MVTNLKNWILRTQNLHQDQTQVIKLKFQRIAYNLKSLDLSLKKKIIITAN